MVTKSFFIIASGIGFLYDISEDNFAEIAQDMYLWYGFKINDWIASSRGQWVNTLRLRQNGRHFVNDSFKCIFLNENVWMLLHISLKFVPEGSIKNIPALVQIMAWHQWGNKPLSEPMMVRLPTHICVTWPQWVKAHEIFPDFQLLSVCKHASLLKHNAIEKCIVDTSWIIMP